MKKSEALDILGVSDGASDDEIKRVHRRLVIAHHPDKFPLDSTQRADAEEKTKKINEARDVLLNRSWTPEFDPRRDPRPYAGNPYAHPSASPQGQPFSWDPFGEWSSQGHGEGRPTYVWTSWDATPHTSEGSPFGFDPFNPFAPFQKAESPKTPEQIHTETKSALKKELMVLGGKLVVLGALIAVGSFATGLFVYVIASVAYGLWKRIGSCLIGFFIPLAIVFAPLVFTIAPRQGAMTIGLGLAFIVAVIFEVHNLRTLIHTYRSTSSS